LQDQGTGLGRTLRRAVGPAQASVDIAAHQITHHGSVRLIQKLDPQPRCAEGVGLLDHQLSAGIVAIHGHRKGEAEQKRQNAIKKAGTLFDLDQIQIIAALKGNISKEDRLRLELQLALATENVTEVEKLGKQLAISQGLGQDLAKFLTSLPSAKNPFEAWKSFLDGIEAQAARIAGMQFQMANFKYTVPTGNFTYGQGNPLNTDVFVDPRGGATGDTNITVNVGGSVTTSQSLIDEIRGGLNVAALSGSSANVERRIGGW
jgi:hypothetical protein